MVSGICAPDPVRDPVDVVVPDGDASRDDHDGRREPVRPRRGEARGAILAVTVFK